LSLFPTNVGSLPVWSASEVFVSTPQKNYTLRELEALVAEVAAQVPSNSLAPRYFPYLKANLTWDPSIGSPGVPLTCLYVTDVTTPVGVKYQDNDWSVDTFGYPITYSKGDGTVNTQSTEVPCTAWNATNLPLALGGASHVTMLMDKAVISKVACFAQGHADGEC
jgi:hypothetical protein